MLTDLAQHLEAQYGPLKAALIDLVRIPSVSDEGGAGLPFGEGVDRALRKALEIAGNLGLRTFYDAEGYYGWAETGAGPELVGILGHLDVVPPGRLDDWDHDPFDPVERDGLLYGRGVQDDKGGTLAALFAAKALLDAGVSFNKRLRFIFGTDEENLWRCIKRYKEREEVPGMGFSPDARFPLIYAEKGLLQCQLVGRSESRLRLQGGSAFNAVPDSITYAGALAKDLAHELDERNFAYGRKGSAVEVQGKAAHAMEAEKGVNAIARLCLALDGIGTDSRAAQFVAREIGEDAHATRIFGDLSDEPSGKLKINVGKIEIAGAGSEATEILSIDCRIPVTAGKEEIVARLSAVAAGYGLEYREYDWLAPLYLPLDHFLVETLMRVYRGASGDLVSGPISSGGATYARSMPNCVAFGALLPDELITEHQPNERAALRDLYKATEIYAHAIFELTR